MTELQQDNAPVAPISLSAAAAVDNPVMAAAREKARAALERREEKDLLQRLIRKSLAACAEEDKQESDFTNLHQHSTPKSPVILEGVMDSLIAYNCNFCR